jgi:hypothetical protein
MSHAEQLLEIATELTMDAKDEAGLFNGIWLNWRPANLKWQLASIRLSLRFSALAALCRCAAPTASTAAHYF